MSSNENRSILKNYGNSGPSLVTAVTFQEICWFDTRRFRQTAQDHWKKLIQEFPTIRQDAFVILPDRVRFIVWLYQGLDAFGDDPTEARVGRDLFAPDLTEVVRFYKDAVESTIQRWGGAGFAWERGFYSHQIRDRQELLAARQMIKTDPENWGLEPRNPALGPG